MSPVGSFNPELLKNASVEPFWGYHFLLLCFCVLLVHITYKWLFFSPSSMLYNQMHLRGCLQRCDSLLVEESVEGVQAWVVVVADYCCGFPLNPKILLLWFIQRADVCLFPCIFHHTEGQLPHLRSPIAVWNYLAG